MPTTRTAATLASLLALAACGGPKMISTSLNWNPSDDVGDLHLVTGQVHNGWGGTTDVTGPDMTGKVADAFAGQQLQVMPLADARAVKDIGKNVQSDQPKPVTTPDNVADYVTAHVGEVLRACRVPVASGTGTRILKGELNEFFSREDNKYDSVAAIHFSLTDAQGKEIWSGNVRGAQSKFGRSFKAENYNESLSDAVVRAVHQLLEDETFLMAVHKGSKA